jgi:D-isomer specific 2-hydroxyacid dehydrogenase, NAD binding domain
VHSSEAFTSDALDRLRPRPCDGIRVVRVGFDPLDDDDAIVSAYATALPHTGARSSACSGDRCRVKTAAERRICVLGLGSLGQAVLSQLVAFGFDCAGWSRSRHAIEGVRCFAGNDELDEFIARSDILYACCRSPMRRVDHFIASVSFGFCSREHGAYRAAAVRGDNLSRTGSEKRDPGWDG